MAKIFNKPTGWFVLWLLIVKAKKKTGFLAGLFITVTVFSGCLFNNHFLGNLLFTNF
jgi:hypothetical protein